MPTDQQFEIARDAVRSAMNGRKSALSGSALKDLVSELAERVDITGDGSVWWTDDDGTPTYRDGCFTSPYVAVRQMISNDPAKFGIVTTGPAPSAPATSRVVEVPAGSNKPTVTELMRLAKDNPALRERLIANPNGIPASSRPSMTAMMTAAKAGDKAAYTNLLSGLPSNR